MRQKRVDIKVRVRVSLIEKIKFEGGNRIRQVAV
jgi:hypothetical protein